MFHLAAYKYAAAAAQVLVDVPAVTDTIISIRNNHLIVTDPFNLVMAYGLGSTLSELRANWPTLNSYGYHQFWPFDSQGTTASVVPDRPALIDYWSQPLTVPQDEELAIQASMSPGTTEADTLFLWLANPGHQLTLPSGVQRITLKATCAYTPGAAYTWTGAQPLTFETTFRGGWYVVVGLNFEDPNTLACRLIFPKGTPYAGRILRPGCLSQNSYANRPDPRFMGRVGPWGTFNSFELPYAEFLSVNTSAHTADMRFDVIYLGDTQAAPQGY